MKAARVSTFLCVAVALFCYAKGGVKGGWRNIDPWSDVKVLEMAKYALQNQRNGFSAKHGALWLREAQIQVETGMKYYIRFDIARRPCKSSSRVTFSRRCQFHEKYYVVSTCFTTVWDNVLEKKRTVLNFSCKIKLDTGRLLHE
uniref:Putative cystatin-like domain protein n=1 Tax=Amblyomma americanum TaxID=6943 RepID=A0A0C9SF10_AMBAM